jgi:hypothetical protein
MTRHLSTEDEFSRKFSVMQYTKHPVAFFVGNYGYSRPVLGDNRIPQIKFQENLFVVDDLNKVIHLRPLT